MPLNSLLFSMFLASVTLYVDLKTIISLFAARPGKSKGPLCGRFRGVGDLFPKTLCVIE